MKRRFTTAVLAAIVAAMTPTLSAQWPLYSQAAVPKGPDGKPNLSAPAPRTADGKPDLSGIWIFDPQPDGPSCRPGLRVVTFGNAGAGFKDGLPFQPWAAELQKKRAAEIGLNDPDGAVPAPRSASIPHRSAAAEDRPDAATDFHHLRVELRPSDDLHGRPFSSATQERSQPYWHGYSVGRWEGDTLVVESNNFHGVDPNNPNAVGLPDAYLGAGWLDHRGSPYTEAMKLTERFRRVNYGQLEIEFTVDDPKAYTRPFTVRVVQQIVADGSELIEFICHENQTFLKLTGREKK